MMLAKRAYVVGLALTVFLGSCGTGQTKAPAAGQAGEPVAGQAGEPAAGQAGEDVTLAWDAPTANADGTPLTDLAGYRVYRRSDGQPFTLLTSVASNQTGATLAFATGTYELAVTAYDASGNESAHSDALTVTR